MYALKGLALVTEKAAPAGVVPEDTYTFIEEGLFTTLTNVNFDPEALTDWVRETVDRREKLKAALAAKQPGVTFPEGPATFTAGYTSAAVAEQGRQHGINQEASADENVRSLQHTVLYSLKGVAAYAHHAHELGYHDQAIDDYHVEALADLARYDEGDLGEWLAKALRCGEMNYKTMELLDKANTETYGTPVPTEVPLGVKKGKAILVSGHDLRDLHDLLKQTEGKGITIYTHGEMIPTHAYPELKKFPHLYGNWGGAWYAQREEFPKFPGPILMTTNCIREPKESYAATIYTRSAVGWPGVTHLEGPRLHPGDREGS